MWLGTTLRSCPAPYPAIVVFPQAPADERWPGPASRIALAALEQTIKAYRVDADRQYLVGISMGGNGAWYLAYRSPERFAAMVAVCGSFVPREPQPTREPVVPEADGPADSVLATRLAQLPIWMFHGDSDPVIPPDDARRMMDRLGKLGAPVRYTELRDTGHDAWDPAFANPELPTWLFTQHRPRAASRH